jgi:hypothetical protein
MIGDTLYHGDEGRWIAAGDYYFQQFFIKRDWSYDTWSKDRFGPFGTRNPVIGKYIIGASLYLHGVGGRYTSAPSYDFQQDFAWNAAQGNIPAVNELVAARRPIAWMGILSSVLLFFITRELFDSWLTGFCAAVLLVFDPLVLHSSHYARIDTPALFFSLLALGMALRMYVALRHDKQRQAVLWSVGLGIVCGLGVGTKLNALLIFVICGLWGGVSFFLSYLERRTFTSSNRSVLETMRQIKKPAWNTVTNVALFTLVTAITFLALNPFLYPDPVQNTWHLLEFGQVVANYEVPVEQRLVTWAQRWQSLLKIGLEQTGFFHYWFRWPWVDKVLAGLGILVCVHMITRPDQNRTLRYGCSWFAVWLAIELAGSLYWVPFNWPRWYLPLEPCWAILAASGITLLLGGCWQVCRRIGRLRASMRL